MEKRIHVRAKFTEFVLGSSPSSKTVYSDFIGANAKSEEDLDEELDALGEDVPGRPMTIFPKLDDGTPFFWDYQIKGYMKDACGMLSRVGGKDETGKKKKVNESSKLTAFKKVIDGLIFVFPRKIPIMQHGEIEVNERSLRAQTPKGERVSLACSEQIAGGAEIEFDILCLSEDFVPAVIEWLDYGILRGLGQWRNSGAGRFLYEAFDESGTRVAGNLCEG